jgi:nitrite reductase (NO-forming)
MKRRNAVIGLLFAVVGLAMSLPASAQEQPGTQPQATGDMEAIAAGRAVFKRCVGCHSLLPGENQRGPTLHGLFGREAGSVEGYDYSTGLRRADIVWTPETLDEFLAAPFRVVPGMKMLYGGVQRPEDRQTLIAFLQSALAEPPVAVAETVEEAAGAAAEPEAASPAIPVEPSLAAGYVPDVRYTLKTGIADGRMVFIGVGGAIDGVVNPPLTAVEGDVVQITLINGEGAVHDIAIDEEDIRSQKVLGQGASTTVAFRANEAGEETYYCTIPGHRESGMEGRFIVTEPQPPQTAAEEEAEIGSIVSLDPTAVPPPIDRREPQRVTVALESVELTGILADGTTYQYWTFNSTVPGPMVRVRVGDTVELTLANDIDSSMVHSIDLHAVTGPGGGATHTQVDPGDEKKIEFKALSPGLYVYHCATPMVAHHIANGMYGLILVEPEEGLPPVDHEFYVMQGEIYTHEPFGETGTQEFSVEKILDEDAEYVVFNGTVGALTTEHPMHVQVGETVRIFFGVGGPNYTSSFHVIGEIFDRVYTFGDLITPPAQSVQTVTVPPGGSVVTEFTLDVPGRFLLVDHALSRMERGLMGFLVAEGEENPDIYKAYSPASEGSGH